MLIDNFFTVLDKNTTDTSIRASIRLNRSHAIFNGHFPSIPIVPGVCMVQIVLEILELECNGILRLQEAENIKFLAVINPDEITDVDVAIKYVVSGTTYEVQASILSGATTYFKFKGLFTFA